MMSLSVPMHAVTSLHGRRLPSLKHLAVLFDVIEAPRVEGLLGADDLSDEVRAELEWLCGQELLREAPVLTKQYVDSEPLVGHLLMETQARIDEAKVALNTAEDFTAAMEASGGLTASGTRRLRSLVDAGGAHVDAVWDGIARLSAGAINSSVPDSAVFVPSSYAPRNVSPGKPNGTVYRVVLDALPQPSVDTPWEAILDFRADQQARSKLLALRRWMRKIAREPMEETGLRDELEGMMSEYAEYMTVQHKKFVRGPIVALISAAAGALEDLTRLRFGSVMPRLLEVSSQRVALLEAELAAPGREISYIIMAARRFHE